MQSTKSYLSGLKCLHECCVCYCEHVCWLWCSFVVHDKKKKKYFLYVGRKGCILSVCVGPICFSASLLSSVCSWQKSILLPIWCCSESSLQNLPSCISFLVFTLICLVCFHCIHRSAKVKDNIILMILNICVQDWQSLEKCILKWPNPRITPLK